jgi:ribosomal protein L11 methyltransferase
MFSLELECKQEVKDLLIAELWEQGSCGIHESDAGDHLRAFFEDAADRPGLAARFANYDPRWRHEESRDWVEIANRQLAPMLVGSRFHLVPRWRDDPTPAGRLRIEINSGLAFGTGAHETTQLCLESLERLVMPGATVLDVGTGSGILSQAAKLLGAGRVFACDVDFSAVEVARAGGVDCFAGSMQALKPGIADVMVANISPEAIIALAPDLLRCLRAGGVAVVSGFETHEAPVVARAVEAAGGRPRESNSKGSWSSLVVKS